MNYFISVPDLPLPDTPIDRMNWKILVDTATEALRKVSAGGQVKPSDEESSQHWKNTNGMITNIPSTNK